MGYLAAEAVRLRDGEGWYELPRARLAIGARFRENPLVVGYFESRGSRVRFKLRPSLQAPGRARARDARSLERGAVCATRPRAELESLVARLRAAPAATIPAMGVDQLCVAIRDALLAREAAARAAPRGMEDGLRYVYLWNDPLPPLRGGAAPAAPPEN